MVSFGLGADLLLQNSFRKEPKLGGEDDFSGSFGF